MSQYLVTGAEENSLPPMATPAIFTPIRITGNLSGKLLRILRNDWYITTPITESTPRATIAEELKSAYTLAGTPYFKLYVYKFLTTQNSNTIYIAFTGSAPTEKLKHEPMTYTEFLTYIKKSENLKKITNLETFTSDDEILNNRLLDFKQGKIDSTIDLTRYISSSDTLNPDPPEPNIAPTRTDHSTESTSNTSESNTSNHCDTSGMIKTNLTIDKFTPDNQTSGDWIKSAKFALDLANIRSDKKRIALLIPLLPVALAKSVRETLQREHDIENVSFQDFEDSLMTLTQMTPHELENKLNKLTFDSRFKRFRDYWTAIEAIVSELNPDISDKKARDRLVSNIFRQKVPDTVKRSIEFRSSKLNDINLSDLAQIIYNASKEQTIQTNYFNSKRTPGQKKSFRSENRTDSRQPNKSNGDSKANKDGRTPTCWYCKKQGHYWSQCRQLKSDLATNKIKQLPYYFELPLNTSLYLNQGFLRFPYSFLKYP